MSDIRKRAEAELDARIVQASRGTKNSLHELEVHKIELQMQNEELLKTREELAKTRKLYFDLYEMAPVSYCALDEDGFIQEVNLATSSLLGVDRKKLIERPLTDFILPEFQDEYYMFGKKLIASHERQECELKMTKADKTPFWARVSASRETNSDAIPTLLLVISDVSERKIFEEKLKLSASVFKNAGEAIMITDLDGIIMDVNESFRKITGFSPEEAIGSKTSLLRSGQHSKEFYAMMWKTLLETGSWKSEIWNKRKDGGVYVETLIISTVYGRCQASCPN